MQHHKKTIAFAALLCWITAAGWNPVRAQEFLPTAYPDRVTTTLTAEPATGQSVSWRTDTSVKEAKAQLKKEDASPDMDGAMQEVAATTVPFTCTDGREDLYHHVTFGRLEPA